MIPMNNAVDTEFLCLEQVVNKNYQFIIPSYQRPYVWDSINIEDLLNNIEQAFKNRENHYFIGTTLSSKTSSKKDDSIYELIDGQQRITTLMLFALACHEYKDSFLKDHPILNVFTCKKKVRLHFDIRDNIESYFISQASIERATMPSQKYAVEDDYLKHIDAGLNTLKQTLKKINENPLIFKNFIDYMFTKVVWVNTIIPEKTDLNKLFSSMNTSGIQLESVDILKSKILKKITKKKKIYEAIWDACQNMNTYFDKVLRKKIEYRCWNKLKYDDLAQYDADKMIFEVDLENKRDYSSTYLSIQDIDKKSKLVSREDNNNKIDIEDLSEKDIPEENKNHCRSFINFELLLIHTLRIYNVLNKKNDIEERLNASNLQKIFKSFITDASEAEVKEFLHVLWRVRYQFDTWCVKWLEDEEDEGEELRLTYINRQKSKELKKAYFNRTKKEHAKLDLLQSVRIFTGERSAQYWLTPFLCGLINADKNLSPQSVIKSLEKIDNHLSLSADTITQKEASYQLSSDKKISTKDWNEIKEYLESEKGTSFEHYWFQKLEYILWKKYQPSSDKRFKRYRITAKNSVEHVHPQKEKFGDTSKRPYLHAFGNLVLLSPGQNSQYSNKPVTVKKAEFDKKPSYDSLKLKDLFDNLDLTDHKDLTEEIVKKHQEKMLKYLKNHYFL